MKVLQIDYDFYMLPEGMESIHDLIWHLNYENHDTFMRFLQFQTENCRYPYFISEDVKTVYLNIDRKEMISEEEVTVLSRAEYDRRLAEVIKKKCVGCVNFFDDGSFHGLREKLSLDGECYAFESREEE